LQFKYAHVFEYDIILIVDMQDVFIIPDGAPGALAELERRKFTAEEGVSYFLLTSSNMIRG
jgi:ATP-dependent RNA helicase DDX35